MSEFDIVIKWTLVITKILFCSLFLEAAYKFHLKSLDSFNIQHIKADTLSINGQELRSISNFFVFKDDIASSLGLSILDLQKISKRFPYNGYVLLRLFCGNIATLMSAGKTF